MLKFTYVSVVGLSCVFSHLALPPERQEKIVQESWRRSLRGGGRAPIGTLPAGKGRKRAWDSSVAKKNIYIYIPYIFTKIHIPWIFTQMYVTYMQ